MEPWVKTIRLPRRTRIMIMGNNHSFLRSRIKTQSSRISSFQDGRQEANGGEDPTDGQPKSSQSTNILHGTFNLVQLERSHPVRSHLKPVLVSLVEDAVFQDQDIHFCPHEA